VTTIWTIKILFSQTIFDMGNRENFHFDDH